MELPVTMTRKAAGGPGPEGGILKDQFWKCLFYIISRDSRREMNLLIWSWKEIQLGQRYRCESHLHTGILSLETPKGQNIESKQNSQGIRPRLSNSNIYGKQEGSQIRLRINDQ